MIKKAVATRRDKKLSREKEFLVDVIRKVFVLKATQIAETEKAEDMLKMILRSDESKASTTNQKELWQLLEKVRQEVLRPMPPVQPAAPGKRKAPGRAAHKTTGR